MVFTIAGNLQGGWVLAENAQAGFILDKQLEWEAEGSKAYINMITIVTIIGALGIAIGSLIGGIIVSKIGPWYSVLIANFLCIGANFIK